jgi:glutathione peroxidase-family protein
MLKDQMRGGKQWKMAKNIRKNVFSVLNTSSFKNLTPESYNLLNIEEQEDKPYFFGLGFPSKYNCNQGFSGNSEDKREFSQARIPSKSPIGSKSKDKMSKLYK